MPGKENPPSGQQRTDALEREIKDATDLPAPLVSIVRSYLPLATSEMVLEVNNNLKKLRDFKGVKWDGIVVTPDKEMLVRNRAVDLGSLQLDGIIFGKLDQAADTSKSKESADEELKQFFREVDGLQYRYKIYLKLASLAGAKFENILCTPFGFQHAVLTDSSFRLSILTGADFSHANMMCADLSLCYGATYFGKYYHWSNNQSHKSETDFEHANLTRANLYRSNFIKTQFLYTILDNASMNEGIFISASFVGCDMKHANLSLANFSNAKFCYKNNQGKVAKPHRTILFCANATGSNFTNADFTDANLRNAIFSEAKLEGAIFTGAEMENALLSNANFDLGQFTKEQVMSFYYEDLDASAYIDAIYDYMEQNKENEASHKKGFKRAHALLLSFIHGHPYKNGKNQLLAGFLETGVLKGEGSFSSFFSSSDTDKNSLRARLLAVQASIESKNSAVAFHVPRKGSETKK
ncbi:MAG TPA: pentapeptide repeat-containing protein [Gammaproteobacteria bacterium]|nr:pentapeptide repeat-containing protein [Gammaproteobacteria bacterium]